MIARLKKWNYCVYYPLPFCLVVISYLCIYSTTFTRLNQWKENTTTSEGNASFVRRPSNNKQFHTTATKCDNDVTIIDKSRSQSGEYIALMKWFHNLCGGRYIEMGVLDGKLYSNSHVFHQSPLQWKGVFIELMEHNDKDPIVHRPEELAAIHAGVCDESKTLHYYPGKASYEFAAEIFGKKWWGEDVVPLDYPGVKEIDCDTLGRLLLKHAYFDYFSLDVEGAEMSVIRSIDYDRVGFGIILVQADHNGRKNLSLKLFLESKGYHILHEFQRSYWFANRRFHDIYEDIIY